MNKIMPLDLKIVFEHLCPKRISIDDWVDEEILLSDDELNSKYGQNSKSLRNAFEVYISLREAARQ